MSSCYSVINLFFVFFKLLLISYVWAKAHFILFFIFKLYRFEFIAYYQYVFILCYFTFFYLSWYHMFTSVVLSYGIRSYLSCIIGILIRYTVILCIIGYFVLLLHFVFICVMRYFSYVVRTCLLLLTYFRYLIISFCCY